jgi:predicted metal-dependent hydrolase
LQDLRAGIELFNRHLFWEAHEAWEEIWLKATGEDKEFLQGLIQLAAAYHHVQRGTFRGGVRLFDAALRRMEPFPPDYRGVDRAAAAEAAGRHRSRIAAGDPVDASHYPKLSVVDE